MRVKITLACSECKQRNYDTKKNKKNDPDRLELMKYCRFCRKHTIHREAKYARKDRNIKMANDVKTAKKEKKPNLFARIGRYFKDVVGELKKLTWPTGKDLAKYTATVLAFIVLFAVVIGVLDFLFGQGFTLLGSLAGKSSDASALADALLGLM